MARLGSEKKPVRFRVQDMDRLGEIATICEENGWRYVGGLEPDEPENISEVEFLLNPESFGGQMPRMRHANPTTVVNSESKVGRNDPCPCGSGLKYKKCCMAA